ncbi:MAG: hypothetical protein GEV08_19450 [Acidimicrobiia bacterium]|nr:hypothetical protein [Acidimicrobiia bacterium]
MTLVERAPAVRGALLVPGGVRYQRLVVDRTDCRLVVDLHPAITVALVRGEEVAAASRLAAGALGGDTPGVHLELVDAEGRELVLFRPHGGRARVIDVVEQVEVAAPRPPESDDDAAVLRQLAGLAADELVLAVDRLFAAVEAEGFRESARRDRGGRRSRRARARADREAAEGAAVEAAYAAWEAALPEVSVSWAVDHATAVSACAEAARRSAAVEALERGHLRAQGVVAAVAEIVAAPARLPLVLTLPLPHLGVAESELLLDLLTDVLRGRQVLVVTDSPRVAGWARLEALAGRAAVVEPDVVIGAI